MSEDHKHTNRLIHSSSPYLLQHAHNPVHWWEWCDEAFDLARKEDKLVLVSIGYSSCHWCHVMERECFEKEDTAAIMNEHFICIKVDREERPDVDQVYMDAVQLLTGRGGWPLNCFVLPDGRPLHGGTYFPKVEWEKTLKSLSDFYRSNKEEALNYATELTTGIKKLDVFEQPGSEELLSYNAVEHILAAWSENFDLELGGYNWAPKFPLPNNYDLFLHYWYHSKHQVMHQAVHTTLTRMAEGGIFDQAGGGFARYSTDSYWKVPHFEKMLYDNAQLMGTYSKAFRQSRDEAYKRTVYGIHEFISREMTSPEGLFYSALDADSEGEEGKYYTWTRKELRELLGSDEPVFSLYYSVDAYGNWEHGSNILYKTRTDEELERLTGKTPEALLDIIGKCNKILLDARSRRVAPGLDDKVITSWNALMIKGYAEAYLAFGDPVFAHMAEKCADAMLDHLLIGGELFRIRKNGRTSVPAFSEDYAALIDALIVLFSATSKDDYALKAKFLADEAIRKFYDKDKGLFYFQALAAQQLIVNKIDVNDDVIPSSNSMLAKSLYLLAFLFEEERYEMISRKMVLTVQHKAEKFPSGYSNWIQLILWMRKGLYQVVVCTHDNRASFINTLSRYYLPSAITFVLNAESSVPLLANKKMMEDAQVYVCLDKTCGLPQTDLDRAIGEIVKES